MDEDTTAALEWAAFAASLCPGCGRPRAECFAPENERRYEAEALRCHSCAARDRKARRVAEDEHADTAGMFYAAIDAGE